VGGYTNAVLLEVQAYAGLLITALAEIQAAAHAMASAAIQTVQEKIVAIMAAEALAEHANLDGIAIPALV